MLPEPSQHSTISATYPTTLVVGLGDRGACLAVIGRRFLLAAWLICGMLTGPILAQSVGGPFYCESFDSFDFNADLSSDSGAQHPTSAGQRDVPYALLLGNAQDAGYPQAGCQRECCRDAWEDSSRARYAVSLAIIDPQSKQRFIIDCTPDFKMQLRLLERQTWVARPAFDGLLLTHAHIGHYAGLIHLGREVMGTSAAPVFVMPRMQQFLETNGPWDQLVELKNIELKPLRADQPVQLNARISVTPILVPHRGEYSETVAFLIAGPSKKLLFLPDIDRWEDWDHSIEKMIASVDFALLDGTFAANDELPGRDMSTIPHPTIEHSINRFEKLEHNEREKVFFIHLNHTNPCLRDEVDHPIKQRLQESGLRIGRQGQTFLLGD